MLNSHESRGQGVVPFTVCGPLCLGLVLFIVGAAQGCAREAQDARRQRQEAISDLEEDVRDFPDEVFLWQNLARLYREEGRLVAAEDAVEQAVKLAPDDPLTWIIHGDVHKAILDHPDLRARQRVKGELRQAADRLMELCDENRMMAEADLAMAGLASAWDLYRRVGLFCQSEKAYARAEMFFEEILPLTDRSREYGATLSYEMLQSRRASWLKIATSSLDSLEE